MKHAASTDHEIHTALLALRAAALDAGAECGVHGIAVPDARFFHPELLAIARRDREQSPVQDLSQLENAARLAVAHQRSVRSRLAVTPPVQLPGVVWLRALWQRARVAWVDRAALRAACRLAAAQAQNRRCELARLARLEEIEQMLVAASEQGRAVGNAYRALRAASTTDVVESAPVQPHAAGVTGSPRWLQHGRAIELCVDGRACGARCAPSFEN